MSLSSLLRKVGLSDKISTVTLKNITMLMSGTVISAAIPILTAPIMSRIFKSADYGILGIYMSVLGLIGVIAYSHYAQAIMLAKDNETAEQIIWFTLFLTGIVSLVVLLALLFLLIFTNVVSDSPVGFWFFLVPVSLLLNGINTVFLNWANRIQHYKDLTKNRLIQAIVTALIQLSLGLITRNETGLMVGFITGQLVSVVLLARAYLFGQQYSISKPNLSAFRSIGFQYKNILLYSTPSVFINNLINQAPIFLLQKFGGISLVGNYNFTQRFLGLPQQFLSSAVVQVFMQKASETYNNTGSAREIFKKTAVGLALMAAVPFLILAVFAPDLFAFFFGANWREAGVIAQYLCLSYFFGFIISPLTFMYTLAGKFREDFVSHVIFLIFLVGTFYVGNMFIRDKNYLILLYSICYSSFYIFYFFRSLRFSRGLA